MFEQKRIVAVIPARQGSKGIPNKSIRLLEGRPMIWYAIENAKNSNFITDVVVTTDSVEIGIIAKQMGVKLHERDEALCRDDVTLDAVIYDAIKDLDCDYVVTMQPTSPTLQAKTLDAAIAYAIEKNWDTVISVSNEPHLSWRNEGDQVVPNYEARLNRQFLPPHYAETGAFVISKQEVVTEETRIGEHISVFELSEEEAVDVDNFRDMKNAEMILARQKVAIYVNGNNSRGVGHIYRAMEIADEFYVKPDIYYDQNQTEERIFGETTHRLIPVDGIGDLFRRVEKIPYTVFINDILTTSIDYMIGLHKALPNTKIVNFEDDGEGASRADLVFNALYKEDTSPHIKAGSKYYIAAKTFMFYEPISIKDEVKRVFLSFGGADPQNYSDRLLEIVSDEKYDDYEFVCVLGRAKKNVEELLRYNEKKNIEVLFDIKNMPELMSHCDVAVTSRGRTGYELALLGIPSIAMAQNKREEKHGFVSNENGFSYIGLNPSNAVIQSTLDMYLHLSKEDREMYHERLLQNDLRHGRKRVMNLIEGL